MGKAARVAGRAKRQAANATELAFERLAKEYKLKERDLSPTDSGRRARRASIANHRRALLAYKGPASNRVKVIELSPDVPAVYLALESFLIETHARLTLGRVPARPPFGIDQKVIDAANQDGRVIGLTKGKPLLEVVSLYCQRQWDVDAADAAVEFEKQFPGALELMSKLLLSKEMLRLKPTLAQEARSINSIFSVKKNVLSGSGVPLNQSVATSRLPLALHSRGFGTQRLSTVHHGTTFDASITRPDWMRQLAMLGATASDRLDLLIRNDKPFEHRPAHYGADPAQMLEGDLRGALRLRVVNGEEVAVLRREVLRELRDCSAPAVADDACPASYRQYANIPAALALGRGTNFSLITPDTLLRNL